jgi:hypothetical protein
MANPYAKCVIYKLYADDIDEVYIGSTTDMKQRMKWHNTGGKSDHADCYSAILYALSDYEIKYEILERCSVKSKNHLALKEREHMLRYPTRVNKDMPQLIDPAITGSERRKVYVSLNRDAYRGYNKKYADSNKELISSKKKERVVCECGIDVTRHWLSEHKKTKRHKDEMLKKNL